MRKFTAGKKLALEMIRGFRADGILEQCDFEDEFREKGTPQRDLFGEYLKRAQEQDVLSGFTSMLTYFLSFEAQAGAPNEEWLGVVAKHPIERAREIWARRNKRRSLAIADEILEALEKGTAART